MLNFCDFIQVYVFTTNHHLKYDNSFVNILIIVKEIMVSILGFIPTSTCF